MSTRRLQADVFGRQTDFEYSETWIGYATVALRVVMGRVLLYPGIQHLSGMAGFKAATAGTVQGAANSAGNPWSFLFKPMVGMEGILAPLNAWGLFLVGLALILGVAVRWSAFWGAVMMLFYWAASFPLQHSLIVDDHVVYAFLLFGLGAFGAGRILGLDARIEKTGVVRNNPWLKYFLG
ncbi:MAG: DoxX family protein [Haloarculaceae archaeon]